MGLDPRVICDRCGISRKLTTFDLSLERDALNEKFRRVPVLSQYSPNDERQPWLCKECLAAVYKEINNYPQTAED